MSLQNGKSGRVHLVKPHSPPLWQPGGYRLSLVVFVYRVCVGRRGQWGSIQQQKQQADEEKLTDTLEGEL